MEVLTNLIVVFTSQYVHVSYHHIVYLSFIQDICVFYILINYILIKLEKTVHPSFGSKASILNRGKFLDIIIVCVPPKFNPTRHNLVPQDLTVGGWGGKDQNKMSIKAPQALIVKKGLRKDPVINPTLAITHRNTKYWRILITTQVPTSCCHLLPTPPLVPEHLQG